MEATGTDLLLMFLSMEIADLLVNKHNRDRCLEYLRSDQATTRAASCGIPRGSYYEMVEELACFTEGCQRQERVERAIRYLLYAAIGRRLPYLRNPQNWVLGPTGQFVIQTPGDSEGGASFPTG